MLAAISFDTLAFIALVVIASFFRWISKEAEKAKRKSEQSGGAPEKPARIPRQEETEQERVRRFLEALGQPTSAMPPARIERQPAAADEKRVANPRGRNIFSPLPPLTTVPPPLPVNIEEPSPAPDIIERVVSLASAPKILGKKEILPPILFPETSEGPRVYQGVIGLLSSTRGLRDAVILREIFGPPRGLQTSEF